MKLQRLFYLSFLAIGLSLAACQNSNGQTTDASINDTIAQEPIKATIFFVGDAMQHGPQLNRAKALGKGAGVYDYSECFTLIAPTAKSADYAVVNLEVPLGGGKGGYSGYPCFSAPDAYAIALKDAGFDMFLTANNHMLDRSDDGLRRTIYALDSMKVDHIGTYNDKADRDAKTPFIKDIKGIKVGFLNYTYGTNGIKAKKGAEVNYIDKEQIEKEIKKTRDAGAELIVVAMHWGQEYHLKETQSQRELADFLANQGVDMIIGGHPHVVEPMHIIDNPVTGKKTLIVYSLGNFISNQKDTNSQGGASVMCTIEKDPDGTARFTGAQYDIFFSAKPAGGTTNYQVVPSVMEEKVPAGQKAVWESFKTTAQKVFSENTGVGQAKK